jgi:hypothetical protein
MTTPHFKIPLNLPHAGTVARRILDLLDRTRVKENVEQLELLLAIAGRTAQILEPYRQDGENPADEAEAKAKVQEVARLARGMVNYVERLGIGSDRLGQHFRNLFECLELGEEGAALSLRAGEDPKSPQRPV